MGGSMSAVMLLLCYLPNPNDHDYYDISRCIIEYVLIYHFKKTLGHLK